MTALKFVAVGTAGFALQLVAVAVLTMAAGWPSAAATCAAVELAVVHNFFWHERWTWRIRTIHRAGRLRRFVRYQFSTGALSVGGNLAIAVAAARIGQLDPVSSNVVAVVILALLNFQIADRWIFSGYTLRIDESSGAEIARTLIPAVSSPARTRAASLSAPGVSPCTQIVSTSSCRTDPSTA